MTASCQRGRPNARNSVAGHPSHAPSLVALTDCLPAQRIYILDAGLTALSHLGFALVAEGFWSALLLRVVAGIGWARWYRPGLQVLANRLEGAGQSCGIGLHASPWPWRLRRLRR